MQVKITYKFVRDKPELPHWLHLIISRHKPIAYLIGTPVTPLPQVFVRKKIPTHSINCFRSYKIVRFSKQFTW